MKFSSLTNEGKAATGFTHALILDVSDIPAGVATNTSYVFNTAPLPVLKAGDVVKRVLMHLNPAFKDASDAAFNSNTFSVGDAGSATRYLSGVQINENGTEVITSFPGTENTVHTADQQMSVTINSMAAKTISDLDTGRLYVLFAIERANDPRATAPITPGTGYT